MSSKSPPKDLANVVAAFGSSPSDAGGRPLPQAVSSEKVAINSVLRTLFPDLFRVLNYKPSPPS
jgi:hypothetical protein